ncbi:ATP-binding protein [Streptomyces sp. NPDC005303]|uniref:ATP-binding protein n=1 Tax=Streptomyces sp. NPDC005303 TaxID=3155713 RepID=UPI0033BF1AB1
MRDELPLIGSLRAAVGAAPDDVPLRLHLAELLLEHGRADEAVVEVAAALQRSPSDARARAVMARAMNPAPAQDRAPVQHSAPEFDWRRAESEFAGVAVVEPRFTEGTDGAWDVEDAGRVRLADVGGMDDVKRRLEAAFLAPMRNPELRRLYGKRMRGGLLLYGPPGCGKTFIARAVAGELGARFMTVGLSDVLDMYIGQSERNLHGVFETARRNAPCVLFLDELDALGAKRSMVRHSGLRTTVNQLLAELDGIHAGTDEGVFVLAATNHPWDVDTALRRPGRLDRTLLVLPPDAPARASILRYHLRGRPVADVDLAAVVRRTDGYSGADLEHLCETASERALMDSVAGGTPRMIGNDDLTAALSQVRASTGPWFDSARNVAMFANEGGMYDDLLTYFKRSGKRRP